MNAEVLVLDLHADVYAGHLRREFPRLRVHTAKTRAELSGDLSGIDALISFGIAIDDDLMRRLTGLQWIQSLATGVDYFLRCPTLKPGVLITSGRGIHGPAMRETVAYLMLSLGQDARQRHADQTGHRWQRQMWSLLCDKTAVVVGIGVVGTAIGKLLKAFGMRVIGVSRTPRAVEGFDEVVSREKLHEASGRADYLINILPGGAENRGVFGEGIFAAMKPTAYFINVGRGDTVDEAALIECLHSKRIAGAGLDVFMSEPLPKESPLWDMPRVVLSPHVGGYFVEYEDAIMPLIVDNMRLFLAGNLREMRNIVPHQVDNAGPLPLRP
jgi:phosphoglycerate dehydrogenase-like enzyme